MSAACTGALPSLAIPGKYFSYDGCPIQTVKAGMGMSVRVRS